MDLESCTPEIQLADEFTPDGEAGGTHRYAWVRHEERYGDLEEDRGLLGHSVSPGVTFPSRGSRG